MVSNGRVLRPGGQRSTSGGGVTSPDEARESAGGLFVGLEGSCGAAEDVCALGDKARSGPVTECNEMITRVLTGKNRAGSDH
jgi:hypothetical protein